jgi:P-type conjugative transfer protein TrbJ
MTIRPLRRAALAGVVATSLIFAAAAPANAQFGGIVYDPTNYAQNVLTAARELQQVNNQITQIENQTNSLINQAKNLASLPYSLVATITGQIQKTEQLLSQAQRIAYNVSTIDQAFTTNYGAINLNMTDQQMVAQAKSRWQTSLAALQDSLKMQSQAVANITTSRTNASGLMTQSQSATGALQANQATNQLLGLLSQQMADLIAVISAQSRAQALSAAAVQTDKDQGATQLQHFLTPGAGYQPVTVSMFH